MKRLLAFLILLLAASAVRALAADPKPNTLTPKEIADGWLLLFDGETTLGWRIDGDAKVADGTLILGGPKTVDAATTTGWAPFELLFEYRLEGEKDAYLALRSGSRHWIAGHPLIGRGQPGWNRASVSFEFDPRSGQYRSQGTVLLTDGSRAGSTVSGKIFEDMTGLTRVGFSVRADHKLILRNIKLKPLGMQPLFNGKDLSGWKVFKGDPKREKSNFTVTKDGWLNIKDGPGDLQTVGEWSDFVLQFDCISNGKHLNSGVFFRCRPGEYQQGYEAQVRNEFTAEPKQKYVVEEYDPKTGELKGKKDVMSTAVDYGTGAIYRRMPARKEISKDGEWFTMTVLANGRHLATWVNGVQVTDWTDNRPLKDNARNGCRLEKGPISLQGHDPTTDLSFRNFRIAELPEKK